MVQPSIELRRPLCKLGSRLSENCVFQVFIIRQFGNKSVNTIVFKLLPSLLLNSNKGVYSQNIRVICMSKCKC